MNILKRNDQRFLELLHKEILKHNFDKEKAFIDKKIIFKELEFSKSTFWLSSKHLIESDLIEEKRILNHNSFISIFRLTDRGFKLCEILKYSN